MVVSDESIPLAELQKLTTRTIDVPKGRSLEDVLAAIFKVKVVLWSPHLKSEGLRFTDGNVECLLLPESLRGEWQRRWSQTGAL